MYICCIYCILIFFRTGDADLYASQTTTKPTYEPDHYCLQSTTCGEDIIFIPKRYFILTNLFEHFTHTQYIFYIFSFKRPVSIGVYGHPSHEISKYTLLVSELMIEDDSIPYDQISRSSYKDRDTKVNSYI